MKENFLNLGHPTVGPIHHALLNYIKHCAYIQFTAFEREPYDCRPGRRWSGVAPAPPLPIRNSNSEQDWQANEPVTTLTQEHFSQRAGRGVANSMVGVIMELYFK